MIFKLIIHEYLEKKNIIPTYFYDKNNSSIFNKNLRVKLKYFGDKNITTDDYISTFYLNILEPFITNNSY